MTWLVGLGFVVGLCLGFACRSDEVARLQATVQYLQSKRRN